MIRKFYSKIRQFFQFLIEKPSAQGDWRWVHKTNQISPIIPKSIEIHTDSGQTYIYYPLNTLKHQTQSSLASIFDDSGWNSERLIHLSTCLAQVYMPNPYKVKPSHNAKWN